MKNFDEIDAKNEIKAREMYDKIDDEINGDVVFDLSKKYYLAKYSKCSTKSLKSKLKFAEFASEAMDDRAFNAEERLDSFTYCTSRITKRVVTAVLALSGAALITLGALTIANNNPVSETFVNGFSKIVSDVSNQQIAKELGGNLVAVGGVALGGAAFCTKKVQKAIYKRYERSTYVCDAKVAALEELIEEREEKSNSTDLSQGM